MEKTRIEGEGRRFVAGQDSKRYKPELEEIQADVDIEEPNLDTAERNKTLEVLSGLVGKLKNIQAAIPRR